MNDYYVLMCKILNIYKNLKNKIPKFFLCLLSGSSRGLRCVMVMSVLVLVW